MKDRWVSLREFGPLQLRLAKSPQTFLHKWRISSTVILPCLPVDECHTFLRNVSTNLDTRCNNSNMALFWAAAASETQKLERRFIVSLKIWLYFFLRAVAQQMERRFIVSLKIWLCFFLRVVAQKLERSFIVSLKIWLYFFLRAVAQKLKRRFIVSHKIWLCFFLRAVA